MGFLQSSFWNISDPHSADVNYIKMKKLDEVTGSSFLCLWCSS